MTRSPSSWQAQVRRELIDEELERLREVPHSLWRDVVGRRGRIGALVLILGGHYTYARVPLGFWMEDWFGFARNHYDRIGHLMQGFVPAILARDELLRHEVAAAPPGAVAPARATVRGAR